MIFHLNLIGKFLYHTKLNTIEDPTIYWMKTWHATSHNSTIIVM